MPPTRSEHIEQYRRNLTVAGVLESQQHFDWCVTVLFYAALHLADAWLSTHRNAPAADNHGQRNQMIRGDARLNPVWRQYRTLKDYSFDARYNCRVFTAGEVQQLRQDQFDSFVKKACSLLSIQP